MATIWVKLNGERQKVSVDTELKVIIKNNTIYLHGSGDITDHLVNLDFNYSNVYLTQHRYQDGGCDDLQLIITRRIPLTEEQLVEIENFLEEEEIKKKESAAKQRLARKVAKEKAEFKKREKELQTLALLKEKYEGREL